MRSTLEERRQEVRECVNVDEKRHLPNDADGLERTMDSKSSPLLDEEGVGPCLYHCRDHTVCPDIVDEKTASNPLNRGRNPATRHRKIP